MKQSQNDRTVARRRRGRNQRGVETFEFALFFAIMLPGFIWMFISGMNFIRFNKANDVARATALMYVKGQNMNVLGTQEVLARVGKGLDLEVDDGAIPPNQVQSNSRGSGLVVLSEVQFVGPNTCNACTNTGQYVFLQRVYIGNTTLQFNGSTVRSALGSPSTTIWSPSNGDVSNAYSDAGAQVDPSFAGLWSPAVGDGQIVYVVEAFFSGQFSVGQFGAGGVYTRVFM